MSYDYTKHVSREEHAMIVNALESLIHSDELSPEEKEKAELLFSRLREHYIVELEKDCGPRRQ